MKKLLLLLFIFLFAIQLASSASFWVNNPVNCPSTDATNFPGQDCSPNDICGDNSGIAQCFDTNTISAPSSTASSNTDQDGGSFDGGYLINCFVTADASAPFCDNSGNFFCDRNSTCFSTNFRATTCTANVFGVSTCGSCRTNYNDCNADGGVCEILNGASCGSSTGTYNACNGALGNCTSTSNSDCDNDDSDSNIETCNGGNGCEITGGGSCGSGTGTYVANQCNGALGNCTASANRLDCNNDDSDSNEGTCNGADGCEVTDGASCTVAGLPGTVNGCSAGAALCVIDTQHHLTNQSANGSSTRPNLHSVQFGSGPIANFTQGTNNLTLQINNSACIIFPDGTGQCTAGGGGGTTDVIWINDSTTIYINTTLPQNVNFTGNLTLGQKITFALGEIIDNIIDGFIRITGGLNVTGSTVLQGNLTVDSGTLFVDSNNNRVGIGTTLPTQALDVNGSVNISGNIDTFGNLSFNEGNNQTKIYLKGGELILDY